MNPKETFKKQLNHELKDLHFTKHEQVLQYTHPVTKKQKLAAIWNKKIEIPLLPVITAAVIFLMSFAMTDLLTGQEEQSNYASKTWIKAGGNVYFQEEFKRVVMMHED